MFRSLMTVALSVSLLTTSCIAAGAAQVQQPQRLSPQEQAGLKHFLEHADASGRGAVDLRDPSARAAYFAILARHGITRETRPYLFRTLDKAAEQQGSGPVDKSACALPKAEEGVANYRTILDVQERTVGNLQENDASTEVSAQAFDSLVSLGAERPLAQPTFLVDTATLYDSAMENILAQGVSEGYVGEGSSPDPRHNIIDTGWGSNPSGRPVTAVATFNYRTKGNQALVPCYIVIPGLDHFRPKEMKLVDPTNQKSAPGSPIVICINRQNESDGYNDCDYGPMMPGVGNPSAHVKAIVSGSIVYNDKVAPFTDGANNPAKGPNPDGELAVVPRDTGGACVLSRIDGAAFQSHLRLVNEHEVAFDWGRDRDGRIDPTTAADFGPLCWQVVPNNRKWDFVLTLKTATMNKANVSSYSVLATYMSEGPSSPEGNPNIFLLPSLVMQFGCIEKGTKISMVGGTELPIEKVKKGQQVIGEKGAIYNVVETTVGTDDELIQIRVRLPRGGDRVLSVTPAHPIPVAGERESDADWTRTVKFVQAKDLKHGDKIFVTGEHKPVRIAAVTNMHLRQPVQVFNLKLEQSATAADNSDASDPPTNGGHVFYANHVLVGDNAIQNRLIAERQAAAAQLPHREIEEQERLDYENWLKSRAQAKGDFGARQPDAN